MEHSVTHADDFVSEHFAQQLACSLEFELQLEDNLVECMSFFKDPRMEHPCDSDMQRRTETCSGSCTLSSCPDSFPSWSEAAFDVRFTDTVVGLRSILRRGLVKKTSLGVRFAVDGASVEGMSKVQSGHVSAMSQRTSWQDGVRQETVATKTVSVCGFEATLPEVQSAATSVNPTRSAIGSGQGCRPESLHVDGRGSRSQSALDARVASCADSQDKAEQPKCISLEQLIPCEREDVWQAEPAIVFADIPENRLWQAFQLSNMSQDVNCLGRLRPKTFEALAALEAWNQVDEVTELQLYVDGSFSESLCSAGWAVVGVGCVEGRWKFIGYFSDCVHDKGHHKWLGNENTSAHVAELAAMTCALAVVNAHASLRCEIVFDATAAAGVAAGLHDCRALAALAQATTSLTIRAWRCGVVLSYRHTHAHKGEAFNELADTVAKATHMGRTHTACSFGTCLVRLVVGQVRDWTWWLGLCSIGIGLPCVDDVGLCTQPVVPMKPCVTAGSAAGEVPGVPRAIGTQSHGQTKDAVWNLRVATYNALTLKSEARKQALDEMFGADEIHLVGFQEARETVEGKKHLANFVAFGSADHNGSDGCQLWVNRSKAIAVRADGAPVFLEWRKVVVVVSKPRLLCVTIPAGNVLFAVVVGHAYTNQAPTESVQNWWRDLEQTLKRLPKKAIPLLMLDANAHFAARASPSTARDGNAQGLNAEFLASLLSEHELTTQQVRDEHGADLVTWRSPSDGRYCLDYVVYPIALESCAKTVGVPPSFVDMLGHDHLPVVVEWTWNQDATKQRPFCRWDVARMRDPTGRLILQQMYVNAPCVDWSCHVDDHLQILNEHIYAELCKHFVQAPDKPKAPHISDEHWSAIRARRHTRRIGHRIRALMCRELLAACFQVWRGHDNPVSYRAKQRRARMSLAKVGVLIRRLNEVVRQLARHDTAAHVRRMFVEAKQQGGAQLASLLRGVMKSGRRYRKPTVTPALYKNGEQIVEHEQILRELSRHFAEAEKGQETSISELCAERCAIASEACQDLDAVDLISLPELTRGFLDLKLNKAPGLTSFPPEIYKLAAREAAWTHWPIVAKAMIRQTVPLAWSGTLVAGIGKPKQDPGSVQGWRSIALYEAAAKGVAKAMRERMLPAFDKMAHEAQCGARRGCPIELPSHYVRAYIQAARRQSVSGGVLFLDGRSAYYATLREHLLGVDALSDVRKLEELLCALHPDVEMRDALFAQLLGPGLLKSSGTPAGVCNYIRASMKQSWFTMLPGQTGQGDCVRTCTGTVPGTPLADLLYQQVQTVFLDGLRRRLDEHGLTACAIHGSAKAPAPCWADDVAVLMP